MSAWEQRFAEKVEPEPNSGCWLWSAGVERNGYGYFWKDGKMRSAHRLSYEHHKGQIPDGLDIGHKWDVKSCVNPDHLEPLTHQQNIIDAWKRGLISKRKAR